VSEALSKYPGIRVLTPEPVREIGGKVIAADIPHEELLKASKDYVDDLGRGFLEDVVHGVGKFAVQAVPVTSILMMGATEGARFLMGRATLQESMSGGAARIVRATAYNVVARALVAAGLGPTAIAARMAVRVAETRVRGRVELRRALAGRVDELNLLRGEGAP